MTLIAVNHGQMEAAATQVRTTWSALQSQFRDLQGIVNRLAQAWEGDDQVAYHAYQQKWNSAADELNRGLDSIGRGVARANENFVNAKQANVRTWAG